MADERSLLLPPRLADGALSVWVRVPGELRFKLGSLSRLVPPPLRASGSQVRPTTQEQGVTLLLGGS